MPQGVISMVRSTLFSAAQGASVSVQNSLSSAPSSPAANGGSQSSRSVFFPSGAAAAPLPVAVLPAACEPEPEPEHAANRPVASTSAKRMLSSFFIVLSSCFT